MAWLRLYVWAPRAHGRVGTHKHLQQQLRPQQLNALINAILSGLNPTGLRQVTELQAAAAARGSGWLAGTPFEGLSLLLRGRLQVGGWEE